MVNTNPDPIKEYYIAYFDILGYKEFFRQHSEQIPELLSAIHDAIQRTNEHIKTANQSPIMREIANIDIHVKIFSDNVLLCMEVADNATIEKTRLLAFFQMIADIQRGFVNEYGLFVRGGIVKGFISFNDDYVFGQGLIDVVAMEESAQYPRIVIEKSLIDYLYSNTFYTDDESNRALDIENRVKKDEPVSSAELTFLEEMCNRASLFYVIKLAAEKLVCKWADGVYVLCYLVRIQAAELLGEQVTTALSNLIQTMSPSDYALISQPTADIGNRLSQHKSRVEEKLKEFGSNADIADGNIRGAELREKVLRKYMWVMAFHNCVCDYYKKPEYKILTRCNCDVRFLKMTLEVLKDETGI